MTLSIEVPAELEANLRGIPDLSERVRAFLKHQASLQSWREGRQNAELSRLREVVYREAKTLQDRNTPRQLIGGQMLDAYDQLFRRSQSHE